MGDIFSTVSTGSIPLSLAIADSSGGIAGLTPTVSIRRGSQYLDWNDLTFKSSGWVEKNHNLPEIGGGHYTQSVALSTLPIAENQTLFAEYAATNGTWSAVDCDVFVIVSAADTGDLTQIAADLAVLRKHAKNRIEWATGENFATMTVYDDDDITPLWSHTFTDEDGNRVRKLLGSPANRSKAV